MEHIGSNVEMMMDTTHGIPSKSIPPAFHQPPPSILQFAKAK